MTLQNDKLKKNTKYILGFLILNIIPLLLGALNIWLESHIVYFYWAEIILLGFFGLIFVVVMYARRISVFLIFLLVPSLIAIPTYEIWGEILKIHIIFWGLYFLCWLAYIEMHKSKFSHMLRRLPLMQQFLAYLLFMTLAIEICFFLTFLFYGSWAMILELPSSFYMIFIGMAVAIPTLSLGLLKIIDMIGQQHFLKFLFGTYHQPVEQENIVLFLDMVDSSSIAEKLSPKDSMRFIARFIFDASVIIRRHGGDIVNYTGDGLLVLWPKNKADKALDAVTAMFADFKKNAHIYEEEFGIKPGFRIGIHTGTIVISQIGEEKLFIGVYGDVVNIASRLERMNKKLKTKVLCSGAFQESLSKLKQGFLRALGKKTIRGRGEKIAVFTLCDTV